MRLESALFSSISGLNSHGSAISVVGDNVSNSNTVGFKRGRSEFSDILSETGAYDGGVTGSGAQVGTVRNIFSAGVAEQTGRNLDAAIEGEGFFVLGNPAAANPTDAAFYSRAGNFVMSDTGDLTSADGKPVLGYAGAATTGALGKLNLLQFGANNTPTTSAKLSGNLDARLPTKTAPTATTFAGLNAQSSTAQTVEVFDSLGQRRTIALYFTKTAGDRTWQVDAFADGADVGGTAGTPTKIGSSTLTFNENGALTAGGTFNVNPAWAGAAAGNIAVDVSGFTQFAVQSSQTGNVVDGQAAGQVKSYEIRKNGGVFATLDNGTTAQVGTLALANFQNTDALTRAGGNKFTANGGGVTIGAPQANGTGSLQGGALERSTVDMSQEFTDLILFQRGYQASSQMLNTTSQILRDTLGLIR